MVQKSTGQAGNNPPASQTLDRGLSVLEYIAFSAEPVSVPDIATALGMHKSVVYRFVRTLEQRGLIRRTSNARYEPHLYLGQIGAHAFRPLQTAAAPQMEKLADVLGQTVYTMVREHEELVTISIQHPQRYDAVAYQPSLRQPLDAGAAGYAWLSAQPPHPDEDRAVKLARERGYGQSTGEVIPGLSGTAAPIITNSGDCIGVLSTVYIDRDADDIFIGHKILVGAHIIGEKFL